MTESRSRGRPRAFDPDAALDAALLVFWERGYSNTSLDALCEAAGVNRPSLYAALGDKKAIYLKAFARYHETAIAGLDAVLAAEPDLERALLAAYRTGLELYQAGADPSRGCLASSTATSEASLDADIAAALRGMLEALDRSFAARFRRAQKDGQASRSMKPAAMGRVASGVLHSLAVRARAGEGRDSLMRYAKEAAASIAAAARA